MVGRVFMGRYRAVRLLGEGGMGKVYLAQQTDTGRSVVVKVLHEGIASQPRVRESFQQEMLFMARFRHPYAVALYDASLTEPGGPCIIMEYIPGVTLDALLHRHRRLGVLRTGKLLGQLCLALQSAHDQGIVHRDLKPANLMVVDPDTSRERIKVMDFGLAMLSSAMYIPVERLADPGSFFSACGTPEYMAPEQVRGDELDHRGDIYSVGVILFEMLTGRVPFSKISVEKTLLAQAEERVPRMAQVLGGTGAPPPAIEEVVQACLSKYPNERPQSAREVAEWYEKALGQRIWKPEEVPPAPPLTSTPPPPGLAAAVKKDKPIDPNAIVHHLEAWMPERIAVVKLKGFVDDVGGEVIESVPGVLRVRLGGARQEAATGSGLFSRLGLGRKPEARPGNRINVELRMEKKDSGRQSRLQITVVLVPEGGRTQAADPGYRRRCDEIHRNLKAYLMGSG